MEEEHNAQRLWPGVVYSRIKAREDIFIPLVVKLFYSILIPILDIYSIQQCWERNISSLLAVLKFYHPTLDLFCWWFKKKYLLMNQAYLLLLYETSDLFLLVSIVRSSLKCCQKRCSAIVVSNEVSTRVDLYSSCLRFCKWARIAPPMFHFAMGWNCSAHGSFSQWAGIGLEFRAL